jgi:uncharacterized protein (DUF1800 family)
MQEPFATAIAVNRFGLGARPGELEGMRGQPRDWLVAQLEGATPVVAESGLRPSSEILSESLELRRAQRTAPAPSRPATEGSSDEPRSPLRTPQSPGGLKAALLKVSQLYRPIYIDEATARLRHAATTDRPFVERLTQFWTNHFAVSVDKIAVLGLAGAFEREAIRPHVLGNFADLLLAVEQHPAMLLYLDNYLSVGPGSRAAQFAKRRQSERKIGINENLAREILELHTLGVNGGYTQADVTTFAEVITGWSIGGDFGIGGRGRRRLSQSEDKGEPGKFTFRSMLHEPGAKTVLGKRYKEGDQSQGEAVLRDLAAKPATANFIATKLARHFIADDPSPAVVERIAKAFTKSHGDLPTVYRALIDSNEAWSEPLPKYKTPSDYIVSTYRALDLPVDMTRRGLASFEVLGQRTYSPGSPAGWPDRSADWDGASALMKRIEWADAVGQRVGTRHNAVELAPNLLGGTLSNETHTAIARAASGSQALTLLLTAPEFLRR